MKTTLKLISVLVILIFMSIAMTGCKTTYVPVESIRTEYRDKLMRDSIYLKDSMYIREKGDTVFINRYSTKYVEKLRVDSFCKTDSVQVPYPVEVIKKVEKELSWWQGIKMEAGGIALGALILVIVYLVIRLIRNIKKLGWKAALKAIL